MAVMAVVAMAAAAAAAAVSSGREGGAPGHAAAIGAGSAVVSCRNHMAPAFPWREPGWALPRACTNSPLAPRPWEWNKGDAPSQARSRPARRPSPLLGHVSVTGTSAPRAAPPAPGGDTGHGAGGG